MPEGTKTFEGLGVPLYGESEIQAQVATNDILTLTGAESQSGDFIVCQHSTATTEKVVIAYDGTITTLGSFAAVDITAASLDVTGQVESLSLAVTGISTADYPLGAAGITTYSVSGLTSSDVVVISPREDTDGALVVDKVEASTLTVRNVASEAAAIEFNYLVIGKT